MMVINRKTNYWLLAKVFNSFGSVMSDHAGNFLYSNYTLLTLSEFGAIKKSIVFIYFKNYIFLRHSLLQLIIFPQFPLKIQSTRTQ